MTKLRWFLVVAVIIVVFIPSCSNTRVTEPNRSITPDKDDGCGDNQVSLAADWYTGSPVEVVETPSYYHATGIDVSEYLQNVIGDYDQLIVVAANQFNPVSQTYTSGFFINAFD